MAQETNSENKEAVQKSNIQSFEEEFLEFLSALVSGKPKLLLEREILKTSVLVATFLVLVITGFGIVVGGEPDFVLSQRYHFLIYTVIASVALSSAVVYYNLYRTGFTCMEGMMIGMTIGMVGGFLFGGIIGATNGMFVGSVIGMLVGIGLGVYCGKCCGIMGTMEGIMAGLMGGTMGAMISIMMIYDNLAFFMPLLIVICITILAGLAYMIYASVHKRERKASFSFIDILKLTFLLWIISFLVIMFGPKGPLTV
ncbi:MAG: hypothetical protein QXT25_03930 [Candidatus Anstonellaceae archaeon]